MADRAHLQRLERELVDKGKLIEAGWVGLRLAAVPDNASPVQLEEMRNAFFAGAQHLFSSIMSIMEPGSEPTSNDIARMGYIDAELRDFIDKFELKHFPAKGSA
ncbi:hypothetical protein [Shinella sp.]|jgi:hypothetical protein|uniref:hypothetical protein n=1 Tax=Shinella sp. TaxID=1870904 RepID=UPI003F709065